MRQVEQEEAEGRDLLGELAPVLATDIERAREELARIQQKGCAQ